MTLIFKNAYSGYMNVASHMDISMLERMMTLLVLPVCCNSLYCIFYSVWRMLLFHVILCVSMVNTICIHGVTLRGGSTLSVIMTLSVLKTVWRCPLSIYGVAIIGTRWQ